MGFLDPWNKEKYKPPWAGSSCIQCGQKVVDHTGMFLVEALVFPPAFGQAGCVLCRPCLAYNKSLEKMMHVNELCQEICALEGGKIQLSIAQVSECTRVLAHLVATSLEARHAWENYCFNQEGYIQDDIGVPIGGVDQDDSPEPAEVPDPEPEPAPLPAPVPEDPPVAEEVSEEDEGDDAEEPEPPLSEDPEVSEADGDDEAAPDEDEAPEELIDEATGEPVE